MRSILLITFILLAKFVCGQDLTGIWRGSFNSSDKLLKMLNVEDRYKFEVQIDHQNKNFSGVTYSYKTTVFYGKAIANGTVNTKTGKVFLQELKIVEVKMQQNSIACVMTCFLQYTKNGNEEFLEGKFKSFGEKDSTSCGGGTVLLRKVPTSDFYKEPFLVKREQEKNKKKTMAVVPEKKRLPPITTKTPDNKLATKETTKKPLAKNSSTKSPVVKPNPKPLESKTTPGIAKVDTSKKKEVSVTIPKVLTTRENELVKTITVNSNEVLINIYDNGTIDHDTVSVFLDKKLVVSRQMLTTSPITVKLRLDDANETHELIMVAENLGDFPPNTSLMVVKAGDKEYEVRISSTEQKNAVVIFKYEKPSK